MEEIFRDAKYPKEDGTILDFTGQYSISNKGQVYSHFWKRIMKQQVDTDERGHYHTVHLLNNTCRINRLVAFAFPEICGEYFDGAVANHLDEDVENDLAENIRWCSHKENINWGTAMRRAEQKRRGKGYYWIKGGIEKRKENNPNNEMYFKIWDIRRKNGTDKCKRKNYSRT